MASGALHGLRVVDLSRMLAGPYCTMLLADQGADVVKVEPPEGDGARAFGPFHADDELRAFGGYFQSINRGKRSIVLDLKTADGRMALGRLLDGADVLVENFRLGVLERLGFSWEDLHARNERLIHASIRGFGDRSGGLSPYATWPAYDLTAQAMGGFMGITGLADLPVKAGPGLGDIFPAAMTTVGILTALHERSRSGVGQRVDVAMYDSVLALCERIVHQHSYTADIPTRSGNSHPLLCPFEVLPAADGWITLASPSDAHWRLLCELIGAEDLAADVRLATNEGRLAHADEVRRALARWTSPRTREDIVSVLGGRFPVGVVQDAADIFDDPHVTARAMTVPLEHPGVEQPLEVAGTPIKLSVSPGGPQRRAPLLGEHGVEVLVDAGFDEDEARRLTRVNVSTPKS